MCIFSLRSFNIDEAVVHHLGEQIPLKSQHTYLGITLDKRLT